MTTPAFAESVTLLIGGARSGKSSLAVRLGRRAPNGVTVIATAEPGDADMTARIARHRAERPDHWHTVETPRLLGSALADADPNHLVIIDCLTMWVSNLVCDGKTASHIEAEAREVVGIARRRVEAHRAVHGYGGAATVMVTNEVGMGVVPEFELGRSYRDVLGRVNATIAAETDRTILLCAGRAVELQPIELVFE